MPAPADALLEGVRACIREMVGVILVIRAIRVVRVIRFIWGDLG